jgi:hypothetical protein
LKKNNKEFFNLLKAKQCYIIDFLHLVGRPFSKLLVGSSYDIAVFYLIALF